MVPRVLIREAALIDADAVLLVPQAHELRWVTEISAGYPFEPAPWHYLNQSCILWQEYTVCESSPMDTHHHVDGVNQPGKPGDI
uniref:A2 n=1 Tax=Arundo donax TaxID=35708 RepID=A0A0A9DBL7_ARUDO